MSGKSVRSSSGRGGPKAPRVLPFGVPPRGWLLAGWALLPVRAFLAFTFLFAGLQKLANPAFFNAASTSGIHAQMLAYIRTSPIHSLLSQLLPQSTAIGLVIAVGEVAVGLGMALGLWTRLAALGGMVIAFSLFLAVSFHSSPWYTGADIVYLFMFTPFVVAGAGGVLSLDARIARRAARDTNHDDPYVVVLSFAQVQQVCGSFNAGRCDAVANRHCAPTGCPYLEGTRPSLPGGRGIDEMDRRAVVLGGVAAVAAAGVGLVVAGSAAGIGRAAGGVKVASSSNPVFTTTTTQAGGTTTTNPLGTLLGPASEVGVGKSASFTVPSSGDPGLLIQPSAGQFVAYDALCPHAGCTVGYSPASDLIVCPCHGSEFAVQTGALVQGPAEIGLTPVNVTEGSDGNLYVT